LDSCYKVRLRTETQLFWLLSSGESYLLHVSSSCTELTTFELFDRGFVLRPFGLISFEEWNRCKKLAQDGGTPIPTPEVIKDQRELCRKINIPYHRKFNLSSCSPLLYVLLFAHQAETDSLHQLYSLRISYRFTLLTQLDSNTRFFTNS